ncbi:MAG: phenylalanine--tRNA ligase subunit beta [Prolixibacteraceae bacterium]|nr:phenylalanine--tRNA ligase subunit beta [Prolixibacteraceae bacterium]
MNISYKWLKDYLDTDLSPEKLGEILTYIGLEVDGIEEVESIKGGLQGLIVGEVLTCIKHPDSDHLNKTTVKVEENKVLPIVCGAPNVAAGQKVIVATVGTTLYDGDKEFKIKKSKIRGEVSEGMLCAEDEIGIGSDHAGIIVLPDNVAVGTPASKYYSVETDYCIEIDLTPNRIDGASHIGAARDVAAYLNKNKDFSYKRPSVDNFKIDNNSRKISVKLETPGTCIRYSGLTISGIEIKESPEWMKTRLKAVGIRPINNVVDITNYVMYETGQPMHSFNADAITGEKIIVKTLAEGTPFKTLDGIDRKLNKDDIMICNTREPMCLAGVFGGFKSGITNSTKNLFLESACFDPVHIRKTARRHTLMTDASFRYERGTDPNGTIYALKRAAMLVKKLAGGQISSDIIDIYPNPVKDFEVEVSYDHIDRLIGKKIGKDLIKRILKGLEIKIEKETEEGLSLKVPPYRVDVKREADIIEEILRIYGYNNVEIPTKINESLQTSIKPNPVKVRNILSELLSNYGFNEIWSNSLTKTSYYANNKDLTADKLVMLLNPLSSDLNCMRQTLLFGGMEAIAFNVNRKAANLRLYEFGHCYNYNKDISSDNHLKKYGESEHLGLFITGKKSKESWTIKQQDCNFYELKSYVENILLKMGFLPEKIQQENISSSDLFLKGIRYSDHNGIKIVEFGRVNKSIQKKFDMENPVYYADFMLETLLTDQKFNDVHYKDLPKYPSVKRDLALLLNKETAFDEIKKTAFETEKKLLRSVDLFDVYEGTGIPLDKKSYAVSFILRNDNKTLNDKQIDKTMERLKNAFEQKLGATLR